MKFRFIFELEWVLCVFCRAFCFENFENRVEILLCTFRRLQQGYLDRDCNLEITSPLNHQEQVICQW